MRALVFLLLFCCLGSTGFTQNSTLVNADDIVIELIKQSRALDRKLNKDSLTVPEARDLQYQISRFAILLTETSFKPDSLYVSTLNNDLALLRSLLEDNFIQEKMAVLKYLIEQFILRIEFSLPFASDRNPFALITVKVEVLRNSQHLKKCEIYCSTYFWKSDTAFIANKDGSPTMMKVPPGRYIFRVVVEGKEIKQTLKDIGGVRSAGAIQEIRIVL